MQTSRQAIHSYMALFMTTPAEETVAPSTPPATLSARPTYARYGVIAFIFALAMVTYLDRGCLGTLAPNIQADLQLDKSQMSWVFSAFAAAYAIFEIPTALWAQRRGTRRVLTRIVVWWSLFTVVTACAVTPGGLARFFPSLGGSALWLISFWGMLTVRFLFGMGESGAWPCAAASFARWIPSRERGIAQGLLFAGAHISGGLTPLLVIFLRDDWHWPWRGIFVAFGAVGFFWAGAWYFWFRDDPAQHKSVGAAELQIIERGRGPVTGHALEWDSLLRLLKHRNTLPLCLMYTGSSYAYYFCITWLPTYATEQHQMSGKALGLAAGLPLIFSVLGDIFGGLTTDWLTKRFGTRIGRTGLGAVAYGAATVSMIVAGTSARPWAAIIALSVAVMAIMFTQGAAWGSVIEIAGPHTGVLGAVMNTAGNVASTFSPVVAIYAKDHWGGWNAPLFVIAGLFAIGAVSWCFIDPRRRFADGAPEFPVMLEP